MRIIEINSVNFGSTGKIMLNLAEVANKAGHSVLVSYPKSRDNTSKQKTEDLIIGSRFSRNFHLTLAKYTGLNGCFSFFSTWCYLRKLKKLSPDLLHLHNLHNCYINLPLLFRYIKRYNIPVIWTLHDCWSFTGQCPHFTMVGCEKWKAGCYKCPQYREYPQSYVDQAQTMWKLKKNWFTGMKNMTIVTPSQWLADLVKESFLGAYPIKVINNGIDLSIFKPTESDFREKYGLQNKKIILGVAFGWGERKGLDVFIELAKRIDRELYQIVLVGTDDNIDKRLPDNIISIHRTQNQQELAEIYTAADLFVNPTREENYPTVNMEALACGTPVVTFKTGGSPEIIGSRCGSVVERDDLKAMEREITRICLNDVYDRTSCMERAKYFDRTARFKEYVSLYDTVAGG